MKEKMRESLLLCLIHDVVMLNQVSRRVTAFVEGPVVRHIRRSVRVKVSGAHERARDKVRHAVRTIVNRIML